MPVRRQATEPKLECACPVKFHIWLASYLEQCGIPRSIENACFDFSFTNGPARAHTHVDSGQTGCGVLSEHTFENDPLSARFGQDSSVVICQKAIWTL